MEYSVGSIVKFRGREWVVLPSDDKEMLSLRPIASGEQDTCGVYLPLEAKNLEATSFPLPKLEDIGDFESNRLLRDAARVLIRYGSGPFRSIGHIAFRPRPYQLVPLLMGLRLNPVRMLIADDVGIGKTIEAALIARELLDRGEIRRIAVICPPHLCDQWQKELTNKFDIDAKVIRTDTISQLERNLPRANLSVFEYYPFVVVSIDYIKAQRRRDAFILHCPEMVIVDEAHGCAKPAGQSIGQQQRHQLIYDLAQNPLRHLIMTTATPHGGVEEPFLSLLEFIRSDFGLLNLEELESAKRIELARHFIQRRRADVKDWMGAETQFPERDPLELSFGLSPEYKKLFEDVYKFAREFVTSEETQSGHKRRVRYWAALALLRCVMSSPEAAKVALLSRIKSDVSDKEIIEQDYSPEIFDTTEDDKFTDIVPTNVIQEGESSFSDNEKRRLREFAKRAEGLIGDADTKMKKAAEEVRKMLREGAKPIVFCRFIATANYVANELKKCLGREFPNVHIISVTGEKSEEERGILIEELCKTPQRVLVATDCLSEGINLQDGFNAVLHYDLPWNPNRLEQREGRVDRFGQTAKIVKAILLYGADNPIDGAVLNVLLRKARQIHKSLGITVPLPVDSESVMEAVLKALFLHDGGGTQLSLFADTPIVEVHRQWDRSAEKEKKSRTLFAQHAIKPDEMAKELEETDSVLGNPLVVERFIKIACQRLGSPLTTSANYKTLDSTRLPEEIRTRINLGNSAKVTFEQPAMEGVTYIHRNHVLTNVIAEHLFNEALDTNGKQRIVTRCGVIRSKNVSVLTVLLLLRLRFLIKDTESEIGNMAEECMITGFYDSEGARKWLSKDEAEPIFQNIMPSMNLVEGDKKYWVNNVLNHMDKIQGELRVLVEKRASSLAESYERLRKTIKIAKVQVSPILPPDILSISIIVPQPKV